MNSNGIYFQKKCIKTWYKANTKGNAYLITSFLILNVPTTVNILTISMKVGEMRKRLTKSWYSAKILKNSDKKQTKNTWPLTIWVTIWLQGSEKDGRIDLSNARVWIQMVFVSKKKCIKTWCKANTRVNAYLITSFLILNVPATVNMLTISIEAGEMRKPLTKSWYKEKTQKTHCH